MEVTVNGEKKRYDCRAMPVAALLADNRVEAPEMVSVQLNGRIIDRQHYQDTLVVDRDEVEFLYFMGGGR